MLLTDVLLQDWLIGWRKRDQTYSLNFFIFFLYSVFFETHVLLSGPRVKYSSLVGSGTSHKVPEPTKLGYQAGLEESLSPINPVSPAWYSSWVGSGTL